MMPVDGDARLNYMLNAINEAGWCVDPSDPDLIEWQYARLVKKMAS